MFNGADTIVASTSPLARLRPVLGDHRAAIDVEILGEQFLTQSTRDQVLYRLRDAYRDGQLPPNDIPFDSFERMRGCRRNSVGFRNGSKLSRMRTQLLRMRTQLLRMRTQLLLRKTGGAKAFYNSCDSERSISTRGEPSGDDRNW